MVTAYALHRLNSPALADAIAGRTSADAEAAKLADELAGDRQRLDYLTDQWATKKLDNRQWERARRPIEARIEATETRLAQMTSTDTLTGLGTGEELRRRWAELNLDRQAAILRTLIGSITIRPGVRGARALNPDRVEVSWRL